MPLLDDDLFAEFERCLREQGVPAIEYAQPGLEDEAIQALANPLGLSLPREARRWWQWHNGVAPAAGAGPREIGPGRKWLPLEEAVEECRGIRQMIKDNRDPHDRRPIETVWSPVWLPFVHADGLYVLDTGVPEDAPCPVLVHWFDEPEAPPDLCSLGELVALWIEAIERGAWRYDRSEDHWTVDHAVLDNWRPSRRGIV
jgi:cell wall assembly regulator SMI1